MRKTFQVIFPELGLVERVADVVDMWNATAGESVVAETTPHEWLEGTIVMGAATLKLGEGPNKFVKGAILQAYYLTSSYQPSLLSTPLAFMKWLEEKGIQGRLISGRGDPPSEFHEGDER